MAKSFALILAMVVVLLAAPIYILRAAVPSSSCDAFFDAENWYPNEIKIETSPEIHRLICGIVCCRISGRILLSNDDGVLKEIYKSRSVIGEFKTEDKKAVGKTSGHFWVVSTSQGQIINGVPLLKTEGRIYFGTQSENGDPVGIFISTGPNTIEITQAGSHRRIFGESYIFSKKDLRILTTSIYHAIPAGGPDVTPPFFKFQWDWEKMSGSGLHTDVRDKADYEAVFSTRTSGFVLIPEVNLSNGFLEKDWKTTLLGTCALDLGSAVSPGYVLYGSRTGAGTVMKVLLGSDQDLLIDIPQSNFATNKSSWLKSDHLEIWQGEGLQWGIRLSDGKVIPAYGDPKVQPTVERVVKKSGSIDITGLKIHLAYKVIPNTGITVSYSQSRDGKKVDFLLSTSELVFGNTDTLSLAFPISNWGALVKIENGLLNFTPPTPSSAERALVDFEDKSSLHSADWNPDAQEFRWLNRFPH